MKEGRRGFIEARGAFLVGGMSVMGEDRTSRDRNTWKCALQLDHRRAPVAGSVEELAPAVERGADLRIYTEFRHDEHIDTSSKNQEIIREVADFRVTYLLEDRWTAGIITLRQPISLPDGFGARPSMSFFLYNQNGQQAIARPYLDGASSTGHPGSSPLDDHSDMPKYHQQDGWDAGTNAPSSNFIYDFEVFKFWVHDEWEEVLSHSSEGKVLSGSVEALAEEFSRGRDVKVGIRGLCSDLRSDGHAVIDHQVFVQVGSCYYYTERKQFMAASHPVVRVKPAIPLRYESQGWDFGWLMPRSDGLVARWMVDPYTLKFCKSHVRCPIRWFVR